MEENFVVKLHFCFSISLYVFIYLSMTQNRGENPLGKESCVHRANAFSSSTCGSPSIANQSKSSGLLG